MAAKNVTIDIEACVDQLLMGVVVPSGWVSDTGIKGGEKDAWDLFGVVVPESIRVTDAGLAFFVTGRRDMAGEWKLGRDDTKAVTPILVWKMPTKTAMAIRKLFLVLNQPVAA